MIQQARFAYENRNYEHMFTIIYFKHISYFKDLRSAEHVNIN